MVEQIAAVEGGVPATSPSREGQVADLELHLLLEAIVRSTGQDFRDYAQATLKRRASERMRAENVATLSGLQERVLHDPAAMQAFILAMSGNPTEALFRDPAYFRVLREQIVPLLRTYSFVRLWFPGCSTGQDVYAVATILAEHGVLDRCMIYATDISELALNKAKEGVYEISSAEEATENYRETGALRALNHYASVDERQIRFSETLRQNVIFAQHTLATDGSLNEFHAIVARGVLPQFNKALQFRVHNLFLQSLARLGFLCLGESESLKMTPHERAFRQIAEFPIYRRMR